MSPALHFFVYALVEVMFGCMFGTGRGGRTNRRCLANLTAGCGFVHVAATEREAPSQIYSAWLIV